MVSFGHCPKQSKYIKGEKIMNIRCDKRESGCRSIPLEGETPLREDPPQDMSARVPDFLSA